jgi:uroporphyrinogen III methyltransferase/synthase
MERTLDADYITFTSSSTVRNLLASAGAELRARAGADAPPSAATKARASAGAKPPARYPRIVSIGPVTSATLREHGLRVDLEAPRHDVDGLLAAILADAAREAG